MQLRSKAHDHFIVLCKEPAFFCQSIAPGELLQVSDELGAALLAAYQGSLELVAEGETKTRVRREKA